MRPAEVRQRLVLRQELALLDVRDEFAFSQGHPLFAANLPLSDIEAEILDRVPRSDTCIVLYDDDEGYAERARGILRSMGYRDCQLLAGGLPAWKAAGYEIFTDVNSYAKAFGELVETRRHTPSLSATEVRGLVDRQEEVVILDARTFGEFKTMSIPGAASVPGADLVLKAPQAAASAETMIIVNCAGRTRSLIGAQSLINAGIPNPVFALRNGTIGWLLADLDLAHGIESGLDDVDGPTAARSAASARRVSYEAGVRTVDPATLDALRRDLGRTLYCFDLRSDRERATGRLPGFRPVAGGQLVQETDFYAPVRGARIVLFDETGVRAHMTASWLAQMAWEVYVLDGPAPHLGGDTWSPCRPTPPDVPLIDANALNGILGSNDVEICDLAPGPVFRLGHIQGARFTPRSRLPHHVAQSSARHIVVTSQNGEQAKWAVAEFRRGDARPVTALSGGTDAWIKAGLPMSYLPADARLEHRDVYERPYVGTLSSREAMQGYLDWEAGLVEQLERDGTHGFFVI